jgi:hypothetical protein
MGKNQRFKSYLLWGRLYGETIAPPAFIFPTRCWYHPLIFQEVGCRNTMRRSLRRTLQQPHPKSLSKGYPLPKFCKGL